ncbi:helix-turn-helix domain-containing protein [Candidatus Clostridium radicumherbarum]|uniref:Helix-turn-helix domain-containing protein n=1 Tax=Candidatus Clostridium radicumherbarum TaxID=3381662 RepID=A0ABW8TWV4_9CLOT
MLKANADKINWLRIEQGLSISDLSKKANVGKITLIKLFRTQCNTREYTIGKIAKALNVSVKELFLD